MNEGEFGRVRKGLGRLSTLMWDREFESGFLQRGVRNELLIDAAPFAGSASPT
jgi:hypothetical protein